MGERLGEVAQGLAGGAQLLAEQAHRAGVGEHLLEDQTRLLDAPRPGERLHQPEGAHAEGALHPLQAVTGPRLVAVDQAVADQDLHGFVQGSQKPGIAAAEELDHRHQQVAGVEPGVLVGLHVDAPLGVVALALHLLVDVVADTMPLVARGGQAALPGDAQGALEGDPLHDPAVGEGAAAAADLPDALVHQVPVLLEPVQLAAEMGPEVEADRGAVLVVEIDRIHQLAGDIELELLPGGIADPDRARAAIPLEVLENHLGELVPPVDAVHDLQRLALGQLSAAGLEPVHERRRLLLEADAKQRVEGERGVANPGVAVVPVAPAADGLGQRGRRRRDDGAGGGVGEQLEHQRAALDHLPPAPLVGAVADPPSPVAHRLLEPLLGLAPSQRVEPDVAALAGLEQDVDLVALVDVESGLHRVLDTVEVERGDQGQRQGAALEVGDAAMGVHLAALAGVVEGGDTDQLHRGTPPHAADAADDTVHPAARWCHRRLHRHEVDHLGDAVLAHETGEQHVGVGDVELALPLPPIGAGEAEVAAVAVEQAAEHRRRVEARQAAPGDGPVDGHQRAGVQVPDHPMMLNGEIWHTF